jgi:hypothetical protein
LIGCELVGGLLRTCGTDNEHHRGNPFVHDTRMICKTCEDCMPYGACQSKRTVDC